MKIILEQPSYARQVIIEVGSDDLGIAEVWEDLIKPALLALGYHYKTVESLVGEDNETQEPPYDPPRDEGERMRQYHLHPYVSGEEDFPSRPPEEDTPPEEWK
jgi:hypothetical protein